MLRRLLVFLALALALLPGEPRGTLANPLLGERDPPAAPAQSGAPAQAEAPAVPATSAAPPPAVGVQAPEPLAAIGRALLAFQREANRLIGQHMRAIRNGEGSGPLLVGAVLAFAYGVLHALGPGHGKLVVVSYFLAREARLGRGLLMGLQIAVCHVISALVVVALADLLLRRTFGGPPAEAPGVRLASYGMIALVGATMLGQAARRSRRRRGGVAVAPACCSHGHGHTQQGALSLGVGLVPCTGAVLIMLYAMAHGIVWAGAVLVLAIAAGMALTMGGLGILSVVARQALARRVAGGERGQGRLAALGEYAGALAITALGAGLFWAAM